MGGCMGKHDETSKAIDADMANAAEEEQMRVKLLLLGAGDSGKSTIFKQMRIIYGIGFDEEARVDFRKCVRGNALEAIQILIAACIERGVADDIRQQEALQRVKELNHKDVLSGADLSVSSADDIAELWHDAVVQDVWLNHRPGELEMSKDFLDRVQEIVLDSYLPSQSDVLHTRVRTTGIIQQEYNIDDVRFVLFDVGGQKSERKKWIHVFDEVSAVIFVAALSDFDQSLLENEDLNRTVEAITIFDEVCNSRWFVHTAILLFLNKSDLFREKIRRVNIADVPEFNDYSGTPYSYDEGVQYFLEKFKECNRVRTRQLFHHVTCATDTSNVEFVFNAAREVILNRNLWDNGFLA